MQAVGLNPEEVGGGEAHTLHGPPDMPECQPLAIVITKDAHGRDLCLSRWAPSVLEREQIAAGADVLLYVWGWQPPVAVGTVSVESGG